MNPRFSIRKQALLVILLWCCAFLLSFPLERLVGEDTSHLLFLLVGVAVTLFATHRLETSQGKLEAAMERERETAARYRIAVEGTNDGVWDWDMVNNTVYYSPRWKAMLGYEETEISDDYKGWERLVHPEDLPKVLEEIGKMMERPGYTYRAEHRLKCKDGSYRWILTRGRAIFDDNGVPVRAVGFHTDIHNAKTLARQLKEKEALYQELIAQSKNAIAVYRVEGDGERFYFTEFNRAAEAMDRRSASEVLGKEVTEAFPGAEEMGIVAVFRQVWETGTPQLFPVSLYQDQKMTGWRENYVFRLSTGEIVAVYDDRTKEKQYELALERLNKELGLRVEQEVEKRRKREELLLQQSRLAAMGEMIHYVAHHWRQPLNVLAINIQDMEDAFLHGELDRQYLTRTVRASMETVRSMSDTIDQFRKFFREASRKHPFDVGEAVTETLKLLGAGLEDRQIRMEFSFLDADGNRKDLWAEGLMETVETEGFPTAFKHAVVNLVNNARDAILRTRGVAGADYAPGGEIRLTLREAGDEAILTVEDNGGGIAPEHLERIFEPYFTTKEVGEGTGIGLYMAKTVVEQNMGGSLTVENTEEGARFTVRLKRYKS